MANIEDKSSQQWPSHITEKFVPTSFWTQDSEDNDLLDIHLPGFKPEEVRIDLASDSGNIKIEGQRLVDENKCIYIDQTFPIPEKSDTINIMGKFEGDHLHIKVPKIIVEEDSKNVGNGNSGTAEYEEDEESNNKRKKQTEHKQGHAAAEQNNHGSNKKEMSSEETCCVANFSQQIIKKGEGEDNPLETAINFLKGNKGIFLSVVISFFIGVWVSKLW